MTPERNARKNFKRKNVSPVYPLANKAKRHLKPNESSEVNEVNSGIEPPSLRRQGADSTPKIISNHYPDKTNDVTTSSPSDYITTIGPYGVNFISAQTYLKYSAGEPLVTDKPQSPTEKMKHSAGVPLDTDEPETFAESMKHSAGVPLDIDEPQPFGESKRQKHRIVSPPSTDYLGSSPPLEAFGLFSSNVDSNLQAQASTQGKEIDQGNKSEQSGKLEVQGEVGNNIREYSTAKAHSTDWEVPDSQNDPTIEGDED